jgi:hypothetical protein
MNEFTLEERIALVAGCISWIGGDSARIDPKSLVNFLSFPENETSAVLDLLYSHGILIKKDDYFYVSGKGARFVNDALLSLISKWSMISTATARYDSYTVQEAFLKYYSVSHPLRELQMDIRVYVVNFCHYVMENLIKTLGESYHLQAYTSIRKLMVRLSLAPLESFLRQNDPQIDSMIKGLIDKDAMTVERCLIYDDVVFLKYDLLRVKTVEHKRGYEKKT